MNSPCRLAIASRNPVKIQAGLVGFQSMFPDTEFEAAGFAIPSGVSDQPMTDGETLQGAENRVQGVWEAAGEREFAIGIEGGIDVAQGQMYAFAWVVIFDGTLTGRSRSGSFVLPPRVQQLVESGEELGIANDIVFDKNNSKQQGGAIGSLTGGRVSRQALYEHAMALALIPWKSSSLFV